MRLTAGLRGDLSQIIRAELRAGESAVFAGVETATQGLKLALRAQVVGAGLGRRLANTWRARSYPKDRRSLKPGGFVWSKAPTIISTFAQGATVRSRHGFYLAIPLPAAGKLGDNRKKITPAGWERAHGQRLRFVYRRGRPSLLVADTARLNKRGLAVGRKGKRATRRGATIPLFLLLPQVTIRRRLDIEAAANQWAGAIPRLIVAAWQTPKVKR